MVVLKASQNKDGAFKFINYILDAGNHRWAAENILYKVPNKAAMDGLSPDLIAQFPNMGMTPAELLELEQLRDVGDATRAYSKAVSAIKAAN
jgi:spermidine/putrescine transport system substrate-binding protein